MPDNSQNRLLELLAAPGPPGLGPEPRPGVRTQAELEMELKSILDQSRMPASSRELIRALVLLWHDHLGAAHQIAQEIESADGGFVHAIMHRREPDYSNAKYWWRRVGKHPCFPEIARRVADLLKSKGATDQAAKLLPHGEWDAFAFVDACEAAARFPASDERVRLLGEIQRIESEVALEHFLQGEGN